MVSGEVLHSAMPGWLDFFYKDLAAEGYRRVAARQWLGSKGDGKQQTGIIPAASDNFSRSREPLTQVSGSLPRLANGSPTLARQSTLKHAA
jgi:hypothetical protein